MNIPNKQSHAGGWLAAIVSAVGAAVFLQWQPVADYFVNRVYDDNMVLQLDSDSIKAENGQPLLVIRVRVSNRGNVPVKPISSESGELVLDVHHISKVNEGEWIEAKAQPSVAKRTLLSKQDSGLSVPANSYWAKELAIALPKGAYLLEASLTKQDGNRTSEEIVVELGK